VQRVCGGLQRRRRRVRAHAAPVLGRGRRALERTEKSAPKWVGRVGQFAAVRSGTVRGYRRARDASNDLTLDADAALFHRWRKRVKDLEYHMRLFANLHRTPRSRARTRQAALRKSALALGHRTFAESPSKFDDAVVTWWRDR
jgi:hypothetical protein